MAAPSSGGQELQTPTLSPLSPAPGSRAEGLFPSLRWPHCKAHPPAPIPSGFHRLLPNSAPGVKGMLSNLWNFFSAKKQVLSNSEFHSGLLSRHIVCRSLQSPGLPQQMWRGFFPCLYSSAGRGVRLHSDEVMGPCPAASTGGRAAKTLLSCPIGSVCSRVGMLGGWARSGGLRSSPQIARVPA